MLPLTSIVPAAISQPLKGALLPQPWMSTRGDDKSEDGEDDERGLPEYVSTKTIPLGGGDVKVTAPQRDRLRRHVLGQPRSEEHTSELQSLAYLVCRLLLEKKKKTHIHSRSI